jgi:hypothetical protein
MHLNDGRCGGKNYLQQSSKSQIVQGVSRWVDPKHMMTHSYSTPPPLASRLLGMGQEQLASAPGSTFASTRPRLPSPHSPSLTSREISDISPCRCGLIGLIKYSYQQQVAIPFLKARLERTPKISALGSEQWVTD